MGAAAVEQNLTENLIPSIQYEARPIKLLPFNSRNLVQWIQTGFFSSIIGLIFTSFTPKSLIKWGWIGLLPGIIGFTYASVVLNSHFSIAFFYWLF